MLLLAKRRPPPLTSRALLIGICSLFISCLPPRQNAAVWFWFNDGPAFSSANCRFIAVTGGNQLFFVTSAQKRSPRLGRDLLILDLGDRLSESTPRELCTNRCTMCERCGVSSNSPTTLRASRIPRSARVRRPHIAPRSTCRARRSSPRPSSPSCPPPRPPNACSRR